MDWQIKFAEADYDRGVRPIFVVDGHDGTLADCNVILDTLSREGCCLAGFTHREQSLVFHFENAQGRAIVVRFILVAGATTEKSVDRPSACVMVSIGSASRVRRLRVISSNRVTVSNSGL